ncbi:MAG: DNRLRE domain-containing protein [Candidatus Omnitrophota bacterium]|jgi:hypothetical protein|nr:MAG: DNRLRE domain-containing protein [Candidatus Omnitrophota bacterium]
MMKKLSFVVGLALVFACGASAEVITFQQGVSPTASYAGTADAHIISWDGGQNQLSRPPVDTPQNTGGHVYIEQGDYGTTYPLYNDSKVILIKFDVSSIPAARAARVKNAKLGLFFVYERQAGGSGSGPTNPAAGQKNPHFLSTQKILKPWDEGNGGATSGVDGDNAPDNSGAVTWNSTGRELWEAIGAEGPTDVGPVESRTWFDPSKLNAWLWLDITQMAKEWIASPASNNGMKVSQETDNIATNDPSPYVGGAYNFASRNNATAANRPQLVIDLFADSGVSSEWSIYQ